MIDFDLKFRSIVPKESQESIRHKLRIGNKRIIKNVMQMMYDTYVEKAPKHTGAFIRSIKVIRKKITLGEKRGVFADFTIGPTHPNSRFILSKTRPSPGRYVKRWDRRISKYALNESEFAGNETKLIARYGMHPGTPGFSINKIRFVALERAHRILENHYIRHFDVRKYLFK